MAGFAEREGRRGSSVVAGMISTAATQEMDSQIDKDSNKTARDMGSAQSAPESNTIEKLSNTADETGIKRNTTLYMRDDVINDAKALAFIKKVSMSNIVESALKDYIAANKEVLEMYKRLFE